MEVFFSVLLGISLSAACGFRIFVPFLVAAIGVRCHMLSLGNGFEWLGSNAALIVLTAATLAEILAYYIPVIDNFLDSLGGPLAALAGTCLTAAFMTDMSPVMQWSLAAIAGGGTASIIHTGTSAIRAALTAGTFGLGNSVFSTSEAAASTTLSFAALFIPIVTGVAVILLVAVMIWLAIRLVKRRKMKLASSMSGVDPG